ncbi:MAG: hypothetical protein RMJ39_10235 [Deltaproteobacteria bacterium]|nr:hypothetical protein [Deltaproteobacteria bacterium]
MDAGIPHRALIAISDLLDNCAKIQEGQNVLILAYRDGLYGGDNLIDEHVVSWLETCVKMRGAKAYVLWADERSIYHKWEFPKLIRGAFEASDVMINNTFDLVFEEIVEFKQFIWEKKKLMIRNFAVTKGLLMTDWALTPHELVSEIRYRSCIPIQEGLPFVITDKNGTHLEGIIDAAYHPNHPWFTSYTVRREEVGYYRPWPEWVVPPIRLKNVNGVLVFDRMLSWWTRVMGVSPYLKEPITVTVKDSKMVKIEGGEEAKKLSAFFQYLSKFLGDKTYDFNCFHFGVHPNAKVDLHTCPHILYHRIIDHSHTSNIHFHLGAPPPTDEYPYWVHCTGDIRDATLKIGDTLIYENGRLLVLDDPYIKKVAEKYPDRPTL